MLEKKFGIEIHPTWHDTADSSPEVFVADVRSELARILRSQAGEAIANSLQFHRKTILLMPYEGQDCGAQTDSVSANNRQTVVLYTARLLRASPCSNKKKGGNNATLPHEILFHELVHALRRVSHNNHPRKVTGNLMGYTDTEEFLSILVTNIFIADASNPHKSGLRGNHEAHQSLDRDLADSFRFFRIGMQAFHIIESFCDENRGFAGLLARIRAPFNPVAAFFRDRRKAFDIAAEGDAEGVFNGLIPTDYYQKPSGAWTRIGQFPRPKLGR